MRTYNLEGIRDGMNAVVESVCRDGDVEFVKENYDLLAKWVKYLEDFGLKPENQLCTDDFAGHLANNINLAIYI